MRTADTSATLFLAFVVLIFGSTTAFAQEVPRWEVGPTISLHKFNADDSNSYFGIGGRGVLNFSRIFGAEVQYAHTSRSSQYDDTSTFFESDDQLTANLKTTWRPQSVRWINPFGLSGMGVTRYSFHLDSSTPYSFALPPHESWFALRLGGGAEIVPHPQIAIRLEVSNLMTYIPAQFAPCNHCDVPAYWSHRWDASVSLMVRLGTIRKSVK